MEGSIIKLHKKGATFEAYNWFVLFVIIIMFTAAIYSLYIRTSAVPLSTLGIRAEGLLSEHSAKEMELTHVDEAVKRAAYYAVREIGSNGGVNFSSYQEYYKEVPVIMDSNMSDPNNRYPKSSIEGYFKQVFLKRLCEELTNMSMSCPYNDRSITIVDGDTIHGFAIENRKLEHDVGSGSDVYGRAGVSFRYDFTFKFQNYDLDDYYYMYDYVKNVLYNDLAACSDEICVKAALVDKNKMPYRFKAHSGSDCFSIYDSYFNEYKVNDSLKAEPDQANKYNICIFDETKMIQGEGKSGFMLGIPYYNVAVDTTNIPSLITTPGSTFTTY